MRDTTRDVKTRFMRLAGPVEGLTGALGSTWPGGMAFIRSRSGVVKFGRFIGRSVFLRAGFAVVVSSMTAGCGMSSLTSGLGGSVFGSSAAPTSDVVAVNDDQLLSAAKAGDGSAPAAITGDAGGCPRFVVGPRDNNLTIYETGRVGDGLAVMHRGEITKTARECKIEAGQVTVRYGFSGRVLLGPKGKNGNIKLPVNVTVTDAKRQKVAGDALKVDVDVAVDKPIGYFSAVKSITIPIPEGSRPGEFEIFIGFDRAVPGAG
jgi:hypothetical protein